MSGNHPYHQHVHPFQLISGFRFGPPNYYQPGDWHDTIQDHGIIRYMPTVFSGKVMIHCHILTHEDEGMMGVEYINATGNACECGTFPDDDFPVYAIVLIVVSGVLFLAAGAWLFLRRRPSGQPNDDDGPGANDNVPP